MNAFYINFTAKHWSGSLYQRQNTVDKTKQLYLSLNPGFVTIQVYQSLCLSYCLYTTNSVWQTWLDSCLCISLIASFVLTDYFSFYTHTLVYSELVNFSCLMHLSYVFYFYFLVLLNLYYVYVHITKYFFLSTYMYLSNNNNAGPFIHNSNISSFYNNGYGL